MRFIITVNAVVDNYDDVFMLYGKWFARDRSLYKEADEQLETAGVKTGKSINENDKYICIIERK